MKKFDVVIIGAGPAGYRSAEILGAAGKSVCIIDIDEEHIGGVCLNQGCMPVKTLLESSEIYHKLKSGSQHGIKFSCSDISSDNLNQHVEGVKKRLRDGIKFLLKKNKVEFIPGIADFISSKKICIVNNGSETEVEGENIIIATGSKTKIIPEITLSGKIFTSDTILKDFKIPESILIIGGGVIGAEFAAIFSNFGSRVFIVEKEENFLPTEDEEAGRLLNRELTKRGVQIFLNTSVLEVKEDSLCKVKIKNAEAGEKIIETESVLLSIGRAPDLSTLNYSESGIDVKSGLHVNKNMETSVSGIFAIGDLTQGLMLAHSAYKKAEIAACSILGKDFSEYDKSLIPSVVYSNPQIARIGLTEAEALKQGIKIKTIKKFFKENGMSIIKESDSGFVKIIIEEGSKKILGASIVGSGASELIHVFMPLLNKEITSAAGFVFAHPTLGELIGSVLKDV